MKIAVLGDIHANLAALEAVAAAVADWRPDVVWVAGDVVNRGPRPLACLRFVLERRRGEGWQVIRGNHEEYVIEQSRPDAPRSGPRFEMFGNSDWTYRQLDGAVAKLAALPGEISLAGPDGGEVRMTHASMRGISDGIYASSSDGELRPQIAPPPAVLCVGHTHRPFVRTVDHTLLVNVGSVGMPFDGDWRASYAQLSWQGGRWRGKIARVEFDRARMERDLVDSGYDEEAGRLVPIMLAEYRQARPYLNLWIAQYEAAVLAGEIGLAEAVGRFMEKVVAGKAPASWSDSLTNR